MRRTVDEKHEPQREPVVSHAYRRFGAAKRCAHAFVALLRYPPLAFLTRTDFINKKVYPKEGTRVRIPGMYHITTWYGAVGH